MAEHQGPRRHAACSIVVHGMQDVTSKLHPYLISVQIIDTLEGGHDEVHIELDDRNAELQLPPDNVMIQVALGWAGEGPRLPDRGRSARELAIADATRAIGGERELPWGGPGMELLFDGWVSSVESGFGRRSGGRRVWIEGTSGNVAGLAKQGDTKTWGEGDAEDKSSSKGGAGGGAGGAGGAGGGGGGAGASGVSFMEVMQGAFAGSGLNVKLSPEMQKIKEKSWSMGGNSPMDYANAMAKKYGGFMKIAGNTVTIVGKGEGVNGDGDTMETIDAIWGVNLIGWRIKPYAGRPQWGGSEARHFNIMDAEWLTEKMNIGGSGPFGGAKAIAAYLNPVANEGAAGNVNKGQGADSESRRGTGWILLNGEPRAKANGKIRISNARPGVDGMYLMTEVEHNYTRGVGYTTRCNVQYPEPEYGKGSWWDDKGPFDPNAKKEPPPAPPMLYPQTRFLPEEEKAKLRQWYTDRGYEVPEVLSPLSGAPPESQQSYTPEELERLRQAATDALGKDVGTMLESLSPQPAPVEPPPPETTPNPNPAVQQSYTPEELEHQRMTFEANRAAAAVGHTNVGAPIPEGFIQQQEWQRQAFEANRAQNALGHTNVGAQIPQGVP